MSFLPCRKTHAGCIPGLPRPLACDGEPACGHMGGKARTAFPYREGAAEATPPGYFHAFVSGSVAVHAEDAAAAVGHPYAGPFREEGVKIPAGGVRDLLEQDYTPGVES